MSDTNCPYCGEPEETDTPSCITIYRCGTRIYPNGSSETPLICDLGRDLRREREAHNQTKRERDEAREKVNQWERIALRADTERAEVREENAKLRDIAEMAIKLLTTPPAFSVFPTLAMHNEEHGKQLRAELDQLKGETK